MSHYSLLSHIPDPLPHFDNNTPVRVTHGARALSVYHRLLFKQPAWPSASVQIMLCHKTQGCLGLCSPALVPPAPRSFWRGTWSGPGRSVPFPGPSSGCVPPSRCRPKLGLRGPRRGRALLESMPPLGFSTWFRSFITWEWCGSGA